MSTTTTRHKGKDASASSSSFVFSSSRYAGYQEHTGVNRRPVLSQRLRSQHSTGASCLQTPGPSHPGVIPGFIPLGQPSRPTTPVSRRQPFTASYFPPELLASPTLSSPPIEAADWQPAWLSERESTTHSTHTPSPQRSARSSCCSSPALPRREFIASPALSSTAADISAELESVSSSSTMTLVAPSASEIAEARWRAKKQRNMSMAEVLSIGPTVEFMNTHTGIADYGGSKSSSTKLTYPHMKKASVDDLPPMPKLHQLPSDDPTKKLVDDPDLIVERLTDALSRLQMVDNESAIPTKTAIANPVSREDRPTLAPAP